MNADCEVTVSLHCELDATLEELMAAGPEEFRNRALEQIDLTLEPLLLKLGTASEPGGGVPVAEATLSSTGVTNLAPPEAVTPAGEPSK